MIQNEFLVYKNNELGFQWQNQFRSLKNIMSNYQGPVFVYSQDLIKGRAQQLRAALPDVNFYYAMKANAYPEVLKILANEGFGADVVSGGEIEHALNCKIPMSKMVYSGVGKTKIELRNALKNNIYQINVESVPELKRIAQIANELTVKAPVAFRINPDISIQTHPYIATGLKDNKFGIDLSQIPEIIQIAKDNRMAISVVGISLHLGSQMLEFGSLQESLEKLSDVFLSLSKEFSECLRFDFGGGLGIIYEDQNLSSEDHKLKEYADAIHKGLMRLKSSIPNIVLQSEPGRWLVGHAGVLISQIQYIKKTPYKEFIILDTGMNHLVRPSLYEAYHHVLPLIKNENRNVKLYDIVGPICESSDFFAKSRQISEVRQDEFIVIMDCGAYGATMSNDYNRQPRAVELLI